MLRDVGLAILLVMLVPVAILIIGAPVALLVRLVIEIGGRL